MGKTLEATTNEMANDVAIMEPLGTDWQAVIYDPGRHMMRPMSETEQAAYAIRQAAMRSVTIAHMRDCPQERIEQYTATNERGTKYQVTRCQDCGEQYIQPI